MARVRRGYERVSSLAYVAVHLGALGFKEYSSLLD